MAGQETKRLQIFVDGRSPIAFDDEGEAVDPSDLFEAHPRINEVRRIEASLYDLHHMINNTEFALPVDVNWREVNKQARRLARELAEVVKDQEVRVVYLPDEPL